MGFVYRVICMLSFEKQEIQLFQNQNMINRLLFSGTEKSLKPTRIVFTALFSIAMTTDCI